MITQQKNLRRLAMIGLMAVVSFSAVAAKMASSSDEINRAVAASGAADIKQATSAQFVKAFRSVLIQVPEKSIGKYVTTAVTMRPDLAPEIAAAALNSHRAGGKEFIDKQISRDRVNAIVEPAIAAAPNARDAIVKAAIAAEPLARGYLVAARDEGRNPGIDAGNINSASFGTINPGNISDPGIGISPSGRAYVLICHEGQTLFLPRAQAKKHLERHPGDTQGRCPR